MTTPAEELARLQQQIDRCDPEALIDLLIGNGKRRNRQLRQALTKLRAAHEATVAGHERLAALLAARAGQQPGTA